MALNTQMNENERGIFKLSGITGMLIATALLLTILVVLTVFGIKVQQSEAFLTPNALATSFNES